MKESESAYVLEELRAAYPNAKIGGNTFIVYAKNLEPYHFVGVMTVVRCLIRTSKWFPTVAEILEHLADMMLKLPSSEVAWTEVIGELKRVGHTEAPKFSHRLVGDAVKKMGGWFRLCSSPNGVAERARFHDLYRDLRQHEVDAIRYKQLPAADTKFALTGEVEA